MNGNKAITKRDTDFAKWYTDVVNAAHLSSYSNVKGCIISRTKWICNMGKNPTRDE